MKCPVCEREMEKGGLVANGAMTVTWHPEREFEKTGIRSLLYHGGRLIGKPNVLRGDVIIPNAWFCSNCNRIVGIFDITKYTE